MRYRYPALVFIVMIITFGISASFATDAQHLQVSMIGYGQGPYYAPLGQTAQLKMEILNLGPGDVNLTRGEAYLDPGLSGKWQLVHSEDMGDFHLDYLQSAIWAFDLAMPPSIRASNATDGVPQVVLLIRIIYSTASGLQQTEQGQFPMSVPGATVQQANYSIWGAAVGVVAALALGVLAYRYASKRKSTRRFH